MHCKINSATEVIKFMFKSKSMKLIKTFYPKNGGRPFRIAAGQDRISYNIWSFKLMLNGLLTLNPPSDISTSIL